MRKDDSKHALVSIGISDRGTLQGGRALKSPPRALFIPNRDV